VPRPHHFAKIALLADALVASTASTIRAQPAPGPEGASSKAKAPAPATASTGKARFAVDYGACKGFLALAPDLRGLVVAWTAGRYHKLDRWVLDEATARQVISSVEQECEKTPGALFRYKVLAEVKKLK
jgi:HdeA/HdeB family